MMKTHDKHTPARLNTVKHGLFATSLAILTACSGGGDEEPAPVSAQSIENTRWLGECVPLQSRPDYTQIQMAFRGGELIIRNYLYDDGDCQVLKRPGTRRTLGSYTELGPTNSGLYTRIDFFIDGAGDTAHQRYLPLAQDIYIIEAGMLYFGSANDTVNGRPVLRRSISELRFADNNPGYVFDGRDSANSAPTLPEGDAPFEDPGAVTELEGNWRHDCNAGRETRLEIRGNRITVQSNFYADHDCTDPERSERVEGIFTIGSPVPSASGLDLKALAIDFPLSQERPEALADNAHFYLDGNNLYLGDQNSIDFNLPYYLE